MRKKIRNYAILLILLLLAMSASVLWTSMTLLSDDVMLTEREKSHMHYHHFFIKFNKTQQELYKYEAGYSPDLNLFMTYLGKTEALLEKADETELNARVKTEFDKIKRLFSEYKGLVNKIVSPGGGENKQEIMSALSRRGDEINGFITKIDTVSEAMIKEHKNADKSRLKITRIIIILSISVIIMGTVIFILYLRSTILGPFQKFTISVDKVAKSGDLSLRMEVPVDKDLAMLAIRFNDMMDNLEKWDHELKRNYVELQKANEELRNSYSNLEDVTAELEEKSQELSEANEELKSIDRLKNEFMQTVSHELRTPLTPIMGYLELFLNHDLGKVLPPQQEIMNDMYHCSRRLGFVIDSLLEMLSLQEEQHTEKFELIEPESIVRELEKQFIEDAKESKLKCAVWCEDNLANISGARKKLLLMVHHLLTNAVKFTPEGGEVSFTTRQKDKNIEFIIKDTGIGINDEKLKRIFEPFLQVDSSMTRGYEGIGLGLALVKRIVEMHQGKIQIESEEGAGAVFTVSLPTV